MKVEIIADAETELANHQSTSGTSTNNHNLHGLPKSDPSEYTSDNGCLSFTDNNSGRRASISPIEHIFVYQEQKIKARQLSVQIKSVLNSGVWTLIVMVATIWSLFATDILVSSVPIEYDDVFEGLMMTCFIFFCTEFVIACMFVPKYLFSFWFYLDIFATVTMVLDIPMFADDLPDDITGNGTESQSLQSSRAGRAARVGARAGRLSRFLRLIRIAKLVKIGSTRSNSASAEQEALQEIKPTVIGGLFTEITTRKVILVILAVLICSSFISVDDFDGNRFTGLTFVESYDLAPQVFVTSSEQQVEFLSVVHVGQSIPSVYIPVSQAASTELRKNEILKITGSCFHVCSEVWYNIKNIKKEEAHANIILTSVVLVILGLSMYAFARDSNIYMVRPIQNMMEHLHGISEDAKVEDSDLNDKNKGALETTISESSVKKLVEAIDMSRRDAMKQRSIADTLLHSMVPKTIAVRLKQWRWWESPSDKVIADTFEEVTILFTDIVGFTRLSARISAEDVVTHLNNMYTMFDAITEKYGLYKVETIGDSYMLVGGAPEHYEDHAERVCAAALEFKACVPKLQEISGEPSINVRIGMHSGPIVAGVVGFKNPRYHLFGDCVNTASRMESTGLAGEVQISEDTYALVQRSYQCQMRGEIEIKGKGTMTTYMLLGSVNDDVRELDLQKLGAAENPQVDKMKDVIKSRKQSLLNKVKELMKLSGIRRSRAEDVLQMTDEAQFLEEFDNLTLSEQKEVVELLLRRDKRT